MRYAGRICYGIAQFLRFIDCVSYSNSNKRQNDILCFIFEGFSVYLLFSWCILAKELRKKSLNELIYST